METNTAIDTKLKSASEADTKSQSENGEEKKKQTSKDTNKDTNFKVEEWIGNLSQQAQTIAKNLPAFVKKAPFAFAVGAIGVGLVGSWIVKKINSNTDKTA